MTSHYVQQAYDAAVSSKASGSDIGKWAERQLQIATDAYLAEVDKLYNFASFSWKLKQADKEVEHIANLIENRVEGLRNHAKAIRERLR